MQAILSTANYAGVVELARTLQNHAVKLFATGGTRKTLQEGGIEAQAGRGRKTVPPRVCLAQEEHHNADNVLGAIVVERRWRLD